MIHVAGTNGKGSTCAVIRAIGEAAGLRVHVYTSPHLVRFNERIRLAGVLVRDEALFGTGDQRRVRIDRQGMAHHADAFQHHGPDRQALHGQHDAVGRVHMHHRHHVGARAEDAGVDHDLVAGHHARRPVNQPAVQVADHHVLGAHARQHVDRVAAALDDEMFRVVGVAGADMAHRGAHAR